MPIIIKNPTGAPDGASGEKPARSFGRAADQMRPVTLTPGVIKNASGSCMAEFGDTRVLCCATVEECVPRWRKGQGAGWVTAEYAMLPASTNRRTPREYKGRKGRSMEIERLIGRSLRAVCRLDKLGEYTITLDCDVIQADGGTRTASVTGAWVALHDALMGLVDAGKLPRLPLTGQVAAVSCGIVGGKPLLDLDYPEDSHADVDLNLVCTDAGGIVEVQGTGERSTLSRAELDALLDPVEDGADFYENALIKARAAQEQTGLSMAVADDSGLCVDALDGAPGIFSARWAGEHGNDAANNQKLLVELADVADEDRTAHFHSSVVLVRDQEVLRGDGDVQGVIGHELRGSNGFGYDPLFWPAETPGRTMAELSPGEKNHLSHRYHALKDLASRL